MKRIDKIIIEVKKMLDETEKESVGAAAGFDQGWYIGKCVGLEEVLELLKTYK